MKYLILLLLFPVSLSAQWSSRVQSGVMIFNNGDNTVNIGNWSYIDALYQYDRVPDNEIAVYMSAGIGYLEEYNEQQLLRTNTIGMSMGVSDELSYYAGPFISYAWQRQELMYGVELTATLIDINRLGFNMGWKAGMINNTGFVNLNIGLKWQMVKKTQSKSF